MFIYSRKIEPEGCHFIAYKTSDQYIKTLIQSSCPKARGEIQPGWHSPGGCLSVRVCTKEASSLCLRNELRVGSTSVRRLFLCTSTLKA